MVLKILGSSSSGNGYTLTDSRGVSILLECGIPFKRVRERMGYEMLTIQGCLVTHVHGDHFKYHKQYIKYGVNIFALKQVLDSAGIGKHHRTTVIEPGVVFKLDRFVILPFEVEHDVPCLGFLIKHPEMGSTVFITDSFYSPYKFKNVNNWIIEANYSEEVVQQRWESGSINPTLRDRILQSHMSIENTVRFLKGNDLSKTNKIILIHLSDTNSDEDLFRELVISNIGIKPVIADKGTSVEINDRPF